MCYINACEKQLFPDDPAARRDIKKPANHSPVCFLLCRLLCFHDFRLPFQKPGDFFNQPPVRFVEVYHLIPGSPEYFGQVPQLVPEYCQGKILVIRRAAPAPVLIHPPDQLGQRVHLRPGPAASIVAEALRPPPLCFGRPQPRRNFRRWRSSGLRPPVHGENLRITCGDHLLPPPFAQ